MQNNLYSKDRWREYPFNWPEFFKWKKGQQTNDNNVIKMKTMGGKK